MSSTLQWKLLDTFLTEGEGRVVESYLSAQGLDVHLLAPVQSTSNTNQVRLMVRSDQLESAQKILSETRGRSHLRLVNADEKMPGQFKWAALILFLLLVVVLRWVRWF